MTESVGDRTWDAVVIGAGPGGAMAARELARLGRSVLLVDKARFPRWKVCGTCIGATGVDALNRAGMADLLERIGAQTVTHTEMFVGSRSATIAMRGMVAVSRAALDAALARAAVDAGATFLTGVRATLTTDRRVTLHHEGASFTVACRAIVHAGGLRSCAAAPGPRMAGIARIGLGACEPARDRDHQRLAMAFTARGYAGRVVTADGVANWAAAVDPGFIRESGGAYQAVRFICEQAGMALAPPRRGWTGTPVLARRMPAQDGHVYRLGDAAGYVEPVTGEGISWALLNAVTLAPILDRAIAANVYHDHWLRAHNRQMRLRRLRCAAVARAVRSPAVMRAAIAVLDRPRIGVDGIFNRLIGCEPLWRRI